MGPKQAREMSSKLSLNISLPYRNNQALDISPVVFTQPNCIEW